MPSVEQVQTSLPPEVSTPSTLPHAPAAAVVAAATKPTSSGTDDRTYNAQDADVTPPHLLSPRAITSWPAGSDPDVPVLEVVVNEKGTVNAVKSLQRPRTIAEYLALMRTLSAAHDWRFRPAERSGHSVKYRLVIVRGLL